MKTNTLPTDKAKELLDQIEVFQARLETNSDLDSLRRDVERTVRNLSVPIVARMRVDVKNLRFVLWTLENVGVTALLNVEGIQLKPSTEAAEAAWKAIGKPARLDQVIEAEERVNELLSVFDKVTATVDIDPRVKRNAEERKQKWAERREKLALLKDRLLSGLLDKSK